jgi:hypothetical protein
MPDLLGLAERVKEKAQRARNLDAAAEHLTWILLRAQELHRSRRTIEQSLTLLSLTESGVTIPGLRALANVANALLRVVEGSPESVREDTNLSELLSRADRAADASEDRARTAWSAYVREQFPPPMVQALRVLRENPRFRTRIEELETIQAKLELRRNSSRWPRTKADWDEIQGDLTRWKTLTAELPMGEDPEVDGFLRAAAADGAPLASLTPYVTTWLRDNGMDDSFVIRWTR